MVAEVTAVTDDAEHWWQSGSRVQVVGLQSAPRHNGWQGVVLSASDSIEAADALKRGRVAVFLDNSQHLSLKPASLVPVAYTVCEIDGKGIGVLAARDIKCGERLIAEPPLGITTRHSLAAIEELSSAKRALFDSLHNAQAARRSGQPFAEIKGIISTNAISIDEVRIGVFATISRFNHSCIPNVEWDWNEKLQAETVHACRDISCGEELCASYMSVEADPGLCSSHEMRRARLQEQYVFACSCPACTLTGKALAKSDSRRLAIFKMDDEIFEAVRQARSADAVGLVEARLQLLSEEGLEEASVKRRLSYDAYQACKLAGWHDRARKWLLSVSEHALASAGADSAAYEKTKRMLGRPIGAPHDPHA